MGLVGERPKSDFDTEKLGDALLEFAKEYRKLKPNATFSEAADQFFANLKQVSLYSKLIDDTGTPSV